MSTPELAEATAVLEAAVSDGTVEQIADRDLQRILAAALRLYAAKTSNGEEFPPFLSDDGVTATDVATSATAILDAAQIAVFELGMWQAVTGRS
ncbi:hypothetical protein [Amorphus sp. 3PC139-8]|uniref:hypothetical protein n=1 Tax=Amorphus sp. 3PC139-8 TaxID=2735676 RepID=UPI00345C860E